MPMAVDSSLRLIERETIATLQPSPPLSTGAREYEP